MSKHTQSILLFGLILPCGVLLLVLGGIVYGRGKLQGADSAKIQAYSQFTEADSKVRVIETELSEEGRRDQMAYWEVQLGKDFIQSLTQNLNEITSDFNEDQLLRTELSRPSSRSPIAAATENEYSRFKLSFEGGFGPMQRTLAELEMRMPHLVLESPRSASRESQHSGQHTEVAVRCRLFVLAGRYRKRRPVTDCQKPEFYTNRKDETSKQNTLRHGALCVARQSAGRRSRG